ncbi:MAG: penicillin-binding transpeptidase domain-containing protein, partial [Candidatus Omnitrophica bacterium]|nr:penicillin-binding transpeptidase domain-containing protein [Candidatus Omnitrophota bacterium]
IMMTSIQLASVISAVANGGFIMKPYVVREIRDKKGIPLRTFIPVRERKIISPETVRKMKQILVGVVESGTGKIAAVENYKVAGKTGTAQKAENGVYSHDSFTASFVGFIPADNPKLTISVILDKPHPYYFGGVVCTPAFKRIAGDSLQYLNSFSQDWRFANTGVSE